MPQSAPHLDSHAHILEYGATQQLPLEEARSIQGKNRLHVIVASEADFVCIQMPLLVLGNIYFRRRKFTTIHPSL